MTRNSLSREDGRLFARKGQARPLGSSDPSRELPAQYFLDMPIFAEDRLAQGKDGDGGVPNGASDARPPAAEAATAESRQGEAGTDETAGADAVGSLLSLDFRRWRYRPAAHPLEAANSDEASERRGALEAEPEPQAYGSVNQSHSALPAQEPLPVATAETGEAAKEFEVPSHADLDVPAREVPDVTEFSEEPAAKVSVKGSGVLGEQLAHDTSEPSATAAPDPVVSRPATQLAPHLASPKAVPEPSRRSRALPIAAAIAVLAVGGYFVFAGEDSAPEPTASGPETREIESQRTAGAGETPQATSEQALGVTPDASLALAPLSDDEQPGVIARGAEPGSELAETVAGATGAADSEAAAKPPTVDVVRIETDGNALIAGTARPGEQLIVLDNGNPIGTVTADVVGSWMLMPEQHMSQGDHEITLVPNTPEGRVTIRKDEPPEGGATPAGSAGSSEAPPAAVPAEGSSGNGVDGSRSSLEAAPRSTIAAVAASVPTGVQVLPEGDGLPPVPVRNPTRAESEAAVEQGSRDEIFVVQLSVAKSTVSAAQEWLKLQRRFPELLADRPVQFEETNPANGGTYFRIRTGSFYEKVAAQEFCDRFREASQDCLVVKR